MLGVLADLKQKRKGFTIVELVVVVVVIAILAAVVVVGYRGVTLNAVKVGMKSDLDTASSVIAGTRKQGLVGNYPDSKDEAGIKASDGNDIQYTTADGSSYCITVTSVNAPGVAYYYSSESNAIKEGICPGHDDGTAGPWAYMDVGATAVGAINKDGKAYMWGSNVNGQLGDGSTTNSSRPVAVDASGVLAGKTVTDISVSKYSYSLACAVADGDAYCWGYSAWSSRLLGTGTDIANSTVPVPVTKAGVLSGKTLVSVEVAGEQGVCALDDQSRLYCWGAYKDPYEVNLSVLGGSGIKDMAASRGSACVITENNKLYCGLTPDSVGSGIGSAGGLVLAEYNSSSIPAGSELSNVSLGTWGSPVCVSVGGDPYCGGLGLDEFHYSVAPECSSDSVNKLDLVCPGEISNGSANRLSATGYGEACSSSGYKLMCWGDLVSIVSTNRPFVSIPRPLDEIGLGYRFMCGLANGDIRCMGENSHGQLGNGTAMASGKGNFVKVLAPL